MIFFLIIFMILIFWKVKFSPFFSDYIAKSQTDSIKGIFAIIVLFSHLRGYVNMVNKFDGIYSLVLNMIGQLMVTMFYFYSGYGIIFSYKVKKNYSKNFLKNRFLKILWRFDIAVFLFLLVGILFSIQYSWSDYLFCWIGWSSIGNSNWFVFVMLMLYIGTALSFWIKDKIVKIESMVVFNLIVSMFCIGLWLFLWGINKEDWWYNTLLCFPLGMWFALYKEKFDSIIRKSQFYQWGGILISFVGFSVLYMLGSNVLIYSLCACLFCLTLVMINTKIKIDNPILRWLGKYSFEIYIIQRIPMIVLAELGINSNRYLFAFLSISLALGFAVILSKFYAFLENRMGIYKNYG